MSVRSGEISARWPTASTILLPHAKSRKAQCNCAAWCKVCGVVQEFRLGLLLAVVLLYLILVAQFRSFIDPFIILLALPPGLSGVLLTFC